MAKGPIKKRIKRIPGQEEIKGFSGIPVMVTARHMKAAEEYFKHGKKIKALQAAGFSKSNAESNSAELFNEPGMQKAIELVLDRADATIDRVAGVVDEGLSARKVIVVGKKMYLVTDHSERRQYAEFTAKLRNWIPDKKMKLEHSGSIGITDEADKELINWLQSATKK